MLKQNTTVYNQYPLRFRGGATLAPERPQYNNNGGRLNAFTANNLGELTSVPGGTLAPSAWVLPRKDGGLATYTSVYGSANVSNGNLASGQYINGALTGSGDIDSSVNISALGYMVSGPTGNGTIFTAIISSTSSISASLYSNTSVDFSGTMSAQIEATITGLAESATNVLSGALDAVSDISSEATLNIDGTLLAAVSANLYSNAACSGPIVGIWPMIGSLSGEGTEDASIIAIGWIPSDLAAESSLDASANAKISGSASIQSFSELSPESLSSAVWNALSSRFTQSGTMGNDLVQALENVSSGGVPAALTPEQAAMLLELWKIAGLDAASPVVVTSTMRVVGDVTQRFSGTDPVVITRD